MNILLLGPQGSGKGTQARMLCEKFDLFYVSTGDLLRKVAESDPEITSIMQKGDLIPDEKTFQVIKDYLANNNVSGNILFDGFPRTLDQFRWFKSDGMKIDLIFLLNISDEEAVKRLSSRRMDKNTGKIYNLITNPPSSDVNPSDLVQREDDKPEAIKERLSTFHRVTNDLIAEINQEGIPFFEVNGERPINEIQDELVKIFESRKSDA